MYNVTITMKSGQNVEAVAQEIAQLIEQATWEQCRVSVVDHGRNRLNQDRMAQAAMASAEPGLFDKKSTTNKLEPGLRT